MKFGRLSLFLALVACISLGSCSGLPKGTSGGGGGGGGGTGTETLVNVTLTSTPSQTFSFPALYWDIGSVALIDSSGNTKSLGHFPLPAPDFARLQTDSLFLTSNSIAAGNYTKLQIQLNAPLFSYFYNNTNASLLGCAPATVCLIPTTVPGFSASSVTVPVTFTAVGGAQTGIDINFDLSKAVTSASGMTFDFTQPGAITLSVLPRKGQSSGIDSLENFTGTVTAKTATTVSVQPNGLIANLGTFTMANNVEFDDPFTVCSGLPSFSCLAVNQNVSVDGVLNADGTLTAYEVEFLDPAPIANELEGVIISPLANNQFKMILENEMGTAGYIVSSTVTVTLNGAEKYFVDPKNLGISTTPVGFLSSTDLVLGQTVMLKGGTANSGSTSLSNPTQVLLRFSSMHGTISTPSGTIFTLTNVDPFFVNLLNNSVGVQTFTKTTYDNVSGGFSGLVMGTNASVRGLYLNPTSGALQPVQAAQVRTH
jgi:hypothetical protein